MDYTSKRTKQHSVPVHIDLALDPQISLQALGCFVLLAAMHQVGEPFSITALSRMKKNGTDGIKSAIRELQQAGYLKYVSNGNVYVICDAPDFKFSIPKKKEQAPKQTKEDLVQRNKKAAEEFKVKLHDVCKELDQEGKRPSMEIISDFLKYWTESDSLKPEKKLRFEREATFNIRLRLLNRVKMLNKWESEKKKQQHKGRL